MPSNSANSGCGHFFCRGCVQEYVLGAVKEKRFPILCPMAAGPEGCWLAVARGDVLTALAPFGAAQEAYGTLEAEYALAPGRKVHCPHAGCGVPLELPLAEDLPADQPATCPACHRGFCSRCRVTGWHTGFTCAQFQALPPHQRSAEDAAVLRFAEGQQWKQCPRCQLVVERSEGCNHIRCRCGCSFCYVCGKAYLGDRPTPRNHGTPGCRCGLFEVPPEGNGHNGQPDAPAQQQQQLQQQGWLGLIAALWLVPAWGGPRGP